MTSPCSPKCGASARHATVQPGMANANGGKHMPSTHRSTETMYSVSTERRLLARFAGSRSSRTVVMISSTVSGVKDASPSSGQTHA